MRLPKRHASPTRISYPLYLAGLLTTVCGLSALNSVLGSDSFAFLAGVLLVAGYLVSIAFRKLGFSARLVELAAVAAAVLIYAQLVVGRPMSELLLPGAAAGTSELQLATMLLWIEVLRSFTLVSDEGVVFSAIPSVVLISLVATNNVNPEIMALFVIYLVLAAFLLSHRSTGKATEVRAVFRIATVVATLALIIGVVMVVPMRLVCTKAFTAAMPGFAEIRQHAMMMNYSDSNVFQIAQGPIRLSEATVMTASARLAGSKRSSSAYWRGKVFDYYTGHGWTIRSPYKDVAPAKTLSPDGRRRPLREFRGWTVNKGPILEQSVRFIRPIQGSTAYAASDPIMLRARYRSLERNGFDCWQGVYGRFMTGEYQVVSRLPISDPPKLRRAGENYPKNVRQYFLQTVTSTGDVGDLAHRITAGLRTPYDKALAIQAYLGKTCSYDLDAPSVPNGADAVDYFLFTSRAGYCDVFASAMVVMLREVGVPARVATGFGPGAYDWEINRYRVRDMDRHAWAEVYFPDCGWVIFDPTESTQMAAESWASALAQRISRGARELFGGTNSLPVAVALLVICGIVAFSSEIRGIRLPRRPRGPSRLHTSALAHYAGIRRALGVRASDLTPIEAAHAANVSSHEGREAAVDAALLFGEIRYGNRSVTHQDIEELGRLHRIIKSSRRGKR